MPRSRPLDLPHGHAAVLPKVCEYLTLAPGWDGYQGRPLKHETGLFALKILNDIMGPRTPVPHVVPVGNGGVQLEWHLPDCDLELYVAAPYDCELTFTDNETGDSESISLSTDFAVLRTYVARLGQQ